MDAMSLDMETWALWPWVRQPQWGRLGHNGLVQDSLWHNGLGQDSAGMMTSGPMAMGRAALADTGCDNNEGGDNTKH